jgi:hypothetical protein
LSIDEGRQLAARLSLKAAKLDVDVTQWRWPQTHIAPGYLMCYEDRMIPDQITVACGRVERIVIDDRCRLPGRFFGRFTTSGLARSL